MKLIENYVICDDGNIFSNSRLLSWEEREDLAYETRNPELLKVLSQDEDWGVRWSVVSNLSAPTEILEILSQDEDYDVRYYAEKILAQDTHPNVRY